MTLKAEALQAAIVRDEVVSADDPIRLTSEARRILAPIIAKAEKHKQPPTQDLHDYLASKADAA